MARQRSMKMFVPIDINFLTFEEVKDIYDEEGVIGVGVVIVMLLHLLQFRGGIAKLRDVKVLAYQMRKKHSYLLHIINDYRMFRVTPDGQSFYSPYLREAFKLVTEIVTDDDYYQGVCRRQTEQKTASQVASRRRGDSSHDSSGDSSGHSMTKAVAKKMKVLIIRQLARTL